jgi:hypothetical protein
VSSEEEGRTLGGSLAASPLWGLVPDSSRRAGGREEVLPGPGWVPGSGVDRGYCVCGYAGGGWPVGPEPFGCGLHERPSSSIARWAKLVEEK